MMHMNLSNVVKAVRLRYAIPFVLLLVAVAKTCSNIACHGVAAGTYSYYFPGNEMDEEGYPIPELKIVNYGGYMNASTPNWYATGAACSACHGNPPYPPLPASDGSNVWHSGSHASNVSVGPTPSNAC